MENENASLIINIINYMSSLIIIVINCLWKMGKTKKLPEKIMNYYAFLNN